MKTTKTKTTELVVTTDTLPVPATPKRSVGRPREWTEERLVNLGNEMLDWFEASPDNLFFEDFLEQQGLYNELITRQTDTSEEFSQIIKKAKKIQEFKLNNLAIHNKINPIYTMFIMKNHHGYADKQETIITSNSFPMINFNNFVQVALQQAKQIDKSDAPPDKIELE